MKAEKHDLKSLQDILRAVTAENLENFLVDFSAYMHSWVAIRGIVDATNPETLEKTVESANFIWVDDGKHDAKINIQINSSDKPSV